MADPREVLGVHSDPSDDYRGGRAGHWRQPWPSLTVRVLTAAGALVVGFLVVSGASAGRDAAQAQLDRRAELVELIEARHAHTQELAAQLEELRNQLAEAETRLTADSPALQAELAQVEAAAGLTALAGPGVRVTLGDASGECPTGRTEDCRIQDTDLQLVVNMLFAVGAEGVAVNGERVIATTALRSAGGAILVNYRVLSSPYVVEAIGDAETLESGLAASQVGQDFAIWADVYDLTYEPEASDQLTLPAYGGSVRLRAASVPNEADEYEP